MYQLCYVSHNGTTTYLLALFLGHLLALLLGLLAALLLRDVHADALVLEAIV